VQKGYDVALMYQDCAIHSLIDALAETYLDCGAGSKVWKCRIQLMPLDMKEDAFSITEQGILLNLRVKVHASLPVVLNYNDTASVQIVLKIEDISTDSDPYAGIYQFKGSNATFSGDYCDSWCIDYCSAIGG